MCKMARQGSGKSTSRAMGGIGTLTVGFEHFLFNASAGCETKQIDGLLKVSASHDYVDGSHRVKASGCLSHFSDTSHRKPSDCTGFINIGGEQLRQGQEPVDQKTDADSIQQLCSRTRLEDWIRHYVGESE